MGSTKTVSEENGLANSVTSEGVQILKGKTVYEKQRRTPRLYTTAILLSAIFFIQMWNFYNTSRTSDRPTTNSTDIGCSFMNSTDMSCTDMSCTHMNRTETNSTDISSIDSNAAAETITIFIQIMNNWTDAELENFRYVNLAAETFAQIPGALLIYRFSGYRFLIASVIMSSLLHILTPPFMLHPYALLGVLSVQWIIAAPLKIAVLSMWKNWVLPLERARLLTISFYGYFLSFTFYPLYSSVWNLFDRAESFLISGLCGLVWAVIWFIVIPDTPLNDVSMTENKTVRLRNSMPMRENETSRLVDVPWKYILTSLPVLTLGLVHFKMSYSLSLLYDATSRELLSEIDETKVFPFPKVFMVFYAIVIPVTAVFADFWLRKFHGQTLVIRKCFLCGSFSAHALLLFGIFFTSTIMKNISIFLSYVIFAISIPGFITIAFDISPRYVSIVSGIVYTCGTLGATTFWILVKAIKYQWLLIFDCTYTIFVAGIFYKWGSTAEQFWFTSSFKNTKSNEDENEKKPN